jgi:homoserine acetyltransferase
MDVNDIICRINTMAAYNVPPNLAKAKVLVVRVVEDELSPPNEAPQPIADAIPGARPFLYESPLGHLGFAVYLGKADEAIVKFIAETAKN